MAKALHTKEKSILMDKIHLRKEQPDVPQQKKKLKEPLRNGFRQFPKQENMLYMYLTNHFLKV